MDFVLKRKDKLAPYAILKWIEEAHRIGTNEEKLAKAAEHLAEVFRYQKNVERQYPN